MLTLSHLMAKLVDNGTAAGYTSRIMVEAAAAAIDDYLGCAWDELLGDSDDPWRLIMQAFYNQHEDEKDDVVTFISYIILTQCMLNDKKPK